MFEEILSGKISSKSLIFNRLLLPSLFKLPTNFQTHESLQFRISHLSLMCYYIYYAHSSISKMNPLRIEHHTSLDILALDAYDIL